MNQNIAIQKGAVYHSLDFSICTIVNDRVEYEVMKGTFLKSGFTSKCEYIIADNCSGNEFNAYEAINHFFKIAKGEYIIIVHQDVRVVDSREKLEQCLSELERKDSDWAICGNAGGWDYKKTYYHLDDNGDIRKSDNLPQRVFSLDENLLIIKASKNLAASSNIDSFHFYGTDLCIVADFLGYSSYVIPFMVRHLSKGNLKDMELKQPEFVERYGQKLRSRFIQTSCTKFYLGNSIFKNRIYNSGFVFTFIKLYRRLFKH
jgi:hypothetical protein